MHRRTIALFTFVVAAVSLDAQGPTLTEARSALGSCTYETCALRRERSTFGATRIVTGRDGPGMAMGVFGGGLLFAVERVPGAFAEARMGRRDAMVATVAAVIGGLALGVAFQALNRDDILSASDGQLYGSLLVSTAAIATGGIKAARADQHFSRAVWLYNRELPR